MHRFRLSPNNPVRRRLFQVDDAEEAAVDNFANVLQEEARRVKDEKMQKWNFDFENETPLDGAIEWTPSVGPFAYTGRVRGAARDAGVTTQIGSDSDLRMDAEEDSEAMLVNADDEFYEEAHLLEKLNETTPAKSQCAENSAAPLLRNTRRRRVGQTGNLCEDKAVRRNIRFE